MIKKIIIWLFEKYAYDYWCEEQDKQAIKEFQEKYNLKDDKVKQAMIDKQNEPLSEAYEAGASYGYEKAMEKGDREFY